jgi:cytochrome b6-f complex iron-sulfur subunit
MAYVISTKPKPLIGRRGLFQLAVFAIIAGLISLPYIGAALRYLFPAQGQGGQTIAYPLSTLTFDNGVAGPVTYEFHKGQGDVAGVFIVRNGTDVIGLEQTCTHLGCPIAWNATANQFQCPCHGSKFNREGLVVGGPAPLPLYRHHVWITDGNVNVEGRE